MGAVEGPLAACSDWQVAVATSTACRIVVDSFILRSAGLVYW